MKILIRVLCVLCLFALVAMAAGCPEMPAPVSDARLQVRKLQNDSGNGSGVVIAPGFVLTAEHVAAVAGLALRAKGPTGTVLAKGDSEKDLGLLHFPAGAAPCPCAKLAGYEAQPDEPVFVVGFPFGIAKIVTTGTAQGVVQRVEVPGPFGRQVIGRRLILTAPVAPGNSGGGVFVWRDGEFQLVGILVEMVGPLSLAIPLADIKPFLAENM